ncbi:MAG TPA: hypothetical protein VFY24_15875 [Azospira sp.]|nr:hypothetical protein [Azospira sp.]
MMKNTDPPIPHAEFKAATLVAVTVALILAFVLYVLSARGFFEETQRLVLITDNSEGIRSGMDLSFSGFPIGRVNRVELAADGNVRILVDVPTKDAAWLRESSVFTLERSLVGDTRLRAFSALLADPPLADGAERTVLRGDAGEQIPEVLAAARKLLDNLERISAPDSPLNTSLGHVQALTGRMQGRYGALAGVLGSDDNARKLVAALDRTNALLAKTDARLFGQGGVVDESQAAIAQLHGLLREARDSLKKADAILADAQVIAGNARGASADLGALRAEVELSLRKAGQLIDEINRKWPFARDTEVKLP